MLLAALSIGTITYLECKSDRHSLDGSSLRIERCLFLFFLGRKEDIRPSISDMMLPLQSWNTVLDNPVLLLQVSMQLYRPRIISALAFSNEKGSGSLYLGPLAMSPFNF